VVGNNGACNGQAQAGTGFFCREVGFEQPELIVIRHARAVVFDRHADDLFFPVMGKDNFDNAAFGQKCNGVFQQVDEDPFHLRDVEIKTRNIRLVYLAESNRALAFLVKHQYFPDHGAKIIAGFLHYWHPGKTGKFTDKAFKLFYLVDNGLGAEVKNLRVGFQGTEVFLP